MIAVWCIVALAQLEIDSPAATPAGDAVSMLERDRNLLDLHRGYLDYLERNPGQAQNETDFLGIYLDPRYRRSMETFAAALERNPVLRRAYERYTAQLANRPEIAARIESLYTLEHGSTLSAQQWNGALAYLLARPHWAAAFLEREPGRETAPTPLVPLVEAFAGQPGLRPAMLDAFNGLLGDDLLEREAFPWWRMTSDNQDEAAVAYRSLTALLGENPPDLERWRRHGIAAARDPNAQRWLRYWYGTLARSPALADSYPAYIEHLRAHPEEEQDRMAEWRARYGPVYPWPPQIPPPPLPPLSAEPDRAAIRDAARPAGIERPASPARPAKPERPQRPTAPEKPMKPAESGE